MPARLGLNVCMQCLIELKVACKQAHLYHYCCHCCCSFRPLDHVNLVLKSYYSRKRFFFLAQYIFTFFPCCEFSDTNIVDN